MTYTVIVAEDEELLLTNLVQKIQKADPDFLVAGTAQTGDQALALVEKLSPDLVITDIRMPVMDGITLLTKVMDQFPFTKFIITSGFSDFEYAKKAITLKVSDYLLKPVDSAKLKEALSKIKQEFQIAGNDFKVTGIGTSPDYNALFKEMSDTVVDSKVFGTVFVTEGAYDKLHATRYRTRRQAPRGTGYTGIRMVRLPGRCISQSKPERVQ